MKTRNRLYLLLIWLTLFAGCDAFQDANPYPYQILVEGSHSGIKTPKEEVIDTNTEWQQFWQLHTTGTTPPPPLPQVDFASSILVALYAGDRPTNGFSISIARVTELDTDIRIDYRVAGSPGPIPSVTQPFAILRLQKPVRNISIRRIN